MSHKDAPPETPEQQRMAAFYTQRGVVCGWGRDKGGNYLAQFARDAWAAWQAAKAENAPDWFPSNTAAADTYASYKEQRDGAVQALLALRAVAADSAPAAESGDCGEHGIFDIEPGGPTDCPSCFTDSAPAASASLYPCGQKCGRWPNCTCAHMSADERAALTVAPVSAEAAQK